MPKTKAAITIILTDDNQVQVSHPPDRRLCEMLLMRAGFLVTMNLDKLDESRIVPATSLPPKSLIEV